eukprot:CAMPEP_0185711516 /NCGR_PEP_ID=MMETSP1164-20130828/33003_1 /TAXON_ID=1104430 /ORGANISM="Chrysoreinhardia sp, Strain CCMP2950" /LENGTH=236 /DNA_ID=CAMNT_0028379059 /DNA_START=55 /DNA_END=766 /DNA_ORIENTATION=-
MRRRGAACDRETDDRGPQHWKSASRAILASPSRPSSQHRRRLECAHGFARARRDTDVWSRTTRRGQGAATETDVDKTRTSYCTVHLTIGRVPSATEDRVPPRNNDDRTECQLRSPRRNDVTTVMRRSPSGKTLRAMRDILGVRRHPHAQRAPTREPFYAGMRPHVRSAPRGRRRRPGSQAGPHVEAKTRTLALRTRLEDAAVAHVSGANAGFFGDRRVDKMHTEATATTTGLNEAP